MGHVTTVGGFDAHIRLIDWSSILWWTILLIPRHMAIVPSLMTYSSLLLSYSEIGEVSHNKKRKWVDDTILIQYTHTEIGYMYVYIHFFIANW